MIMEIKEFIENFKDQFEDELTCELTSTTRFRDLDDWSSIVALSVMSMIDDEYDVQLNASEMRQANTIQELFDLVSSKL